jgi:ferric-dicitrate binding protein FerR (iron transport regulator)
MDPRNLQELDRLAKGVAELIGNHADAATGIDVARPRSFTPMAARLMRAREKRALKRISLAFAGCALAAGIVGFWVRPRLADQPREALTYMVNGRLPSRAGAIGDASAAEPVLSFSDGTRIELGPLARGRVVELGRHGARIALDEGKAHVQVVHRTGAAWLFEAGPFLISVHGTAFSLGWNTKQSRLDVHMESGVVSVKGPLSGGEVFLRAGQTLSVTLNDQGTPKENTTRDGANSPPLAPVPASPLAPVGSLEPSPRSSAGRSSAAARWVAQLADGDAAAVVADAQRRGLYRVLDSSSSEDLAALADAARYERKDNLARRALLAQRHRFPRSVRAAEASFLLGRLDDGFRNGAERALGRYDQYLEEAPEGAYVSETLGRKMMDLDRTHRQTEARAIATDYLRRFPGGTYSRAAEALVRAP